eukprot:9515034-Alexandrium_andersonii.AAC.1
MVAPSVAGVMVDTIERDIEMLVEPEGFGGENLSWREWRACFENYMSGMNPNWVELLDERAKATRPITVRA